MKLINTILLCLSFLSPANAGQWSDDPQMKQWFESLKSPGGMICCGETDGISDPPYEELEDHTYNVFYNGAWHHAAQDQIVNPPNRKVQYAIVWPGYGDNIRCFMPGTGY